MIFLFFVYGLAFFILGFAVLIYPKEGSTIKAAKNLWLVAAFGITHGINEWLGMFVLITAPSPLYYLQVLEPFVLAISFLFLMQFGIKVITRIKIDSPALKLLPLALFVVWIIVALANTQEFVLTKIWARYLLGVPGIFLTAYALSLQIPQIKEKGLSVGVNNIKLTIGTLLFYGILAGLIVPRANFPPASFLNYTTFIKITGIPVQLLRSICAVLMAYGVTRSLRVFDWETKVRIKSTKDFLNNILNSMQDGVVIINAGGTIRFMNRVFLSVFGKDAVGKKCYEVFGAGKLQHQLCPLEHQLKLGQGDIVELPGVIKNKVHMVSRTVMKNLDGTLAILHIFRDITEIKQLEKTKDSLTHMIVHDLNNPLMSISGRLQMLKMYSGQNLDQEQKEDLEQALVAVKQLTMMIGNLLDISKMEQGKFELHYESFNLDHLIQEVVEQMKPVAEPENKTISLDIQRDISYFWADKQLLRRVISNLINNAIKHSPPKKEVFVKASLNSGDKNVLIQVKDYGRGIPQEYLDKIFDKYVQVKDKTAKQGRGLGLNFCKLAVEAHGGKIWAESEPGQGSTFNFTIPLKK